MKHLLLTGLILLVGCVTAPTVEELEAEAMQTGDWNKVEEREFQQAKRSGRARIDCPKDYAVVCEEGVGIEECKCADRDAY